MEQVVEDAHAAFEAEVIEYFCLQGQALAEHAQGRRKKSDAALRGLIDKYAQQSAYQVAEVYAYRRESDPAFEWLERAYAQRDPGLSSIKSNTLLRNLRGDPRWQPFLPKDGAGDVAHAALAARTAALFRSGRAFIGCCASRPRARPSAPYSS